MKLQKVQDTKALMERFNQPLVEEEQEAEKTADQIEEQPKEGEIEIETETSAETEPQGQPEGEGDPKDDPQATAFGESLNRLTQQCWDVVSYIKSLVIMLKDPELGEVGFPKDDVVSILGAISDDTTISIGMLAKASELVDNSTKQMMDLGTEKAEEIIED